MKQRPPGAAEFVGALTGFAIGEIGALAAPFGADVLPAALHEMGAQFLAQGIAAGPVGHRAQLGKFRIQQPQQVVEPFAVAAVGGGGEQHHVAIRPRRQAAQQLIALVPSSPLAGGAGVGLIHDHEVAAAADEAVAVVVALDRVEAHHRERVGLEQRVAHWQVFAQAPHRARPHHLGRQVKLLGHVAAPLLTQVGRADHRDRADLTAIEQLAGDQQGFHRFAQTHLIGDQQPRHLLLECHQQRHQLVGARLQGQVSQAAERSCPGAQLQQQGIAHQQRRTLRTALAGIRPGEGGRGHVVALQGQKQGGDLLVAAAQGPQLEGVRRRVGQHHPLPAAGAHDRTGRGGGGGWRGGHLRGAPASRAGPGSGSPVSPVGNLLAPVGLLLLRQVLRLQPFLLGIQRPVDLHCSSRTTDCW